MALFLEVQFLVLSFLKCFLSSLTNHENGYRLLRCGECFLDQSVYGRVHSDAGVDFLGSYSA